ncbi:hypothetical protein, variant [Puccinia triticina 1-1 BBBD Race 1]|uniref:Uncharacterized protein n=1 Tax=Puccinia triticina (isolate 1-1 / race 1 (BBBD)) TaxID=630390 RepID=A0A180FZQ6_PUCT1|nr:hypothetical protein PTTG_09616 [Puccinia triticina 1-1 BBBD Race 1]OAV85892.1 hypothetical protein, variant [Puccinia triticina 1-1 BBBD Race 1]
MSEDLPGTTFGIHISNSDPRNPFVSTPEPATPAPATDHVHVPCDRDRAGAHQHPTPLTPPPAIRELEYAQTEHLPRDPGAPIPVRIEYILFLPFGTSDKGEHLSQRFTESSAPLPVMINMQATNLSQLKSEVFTHLAQEQPSVRLHDLARDCDHMGRLNWSFYITEPKQPKTRGYIGTTEEGGINSFVVAARSSSATASVVLKLVKHVETVVITALMPHQRPYESASRANMAQMVPIPNHAEDRDDLELAPESDKGKDQARDPDSPACTPHGPTRPRGHPGRVPPTSVTPMPPRRSNTHLIGRLRKIGTPHPDRRPSADRHPCHPAHPKLTDDRPVPRALKDTPQTHGHPQTNPAAPDCSLVSLARSN